MTKPEPCYVVIAASPLPHVPELMSQTYKRKANADKMALRLAEPGFTVTVVQRHSATSASAKR